MRRNIALAAAAALVASLVAVSAIPAAASTPSTTCQTGDGPPFCVLVIAAPSSVRAGSAFTVQVLVTTDGTVIAKSDPCGSKVAVTLEVSGEPLDEPLSFTALASAGIATFSLRLQDLGSYDLFASGPQLPDAAAATSTSCQTYHYETDSTSLLAVSIPLDQPVAPCPPDTNCVQATSGSGTQATLIAEPGSTWTPKFSGDTYFGSVTQSGHACASGPIDPRGVLGFTLSNTSQTGVIVLALDTTQVTNGIGLFNVCWHQTSLFKSVTGAWVDTGDLPNCSGRDQIAPCVLSRTSGQHNVAFLSILTPAGDTDPFAYGHF